MSPGRGGGAVGGATWRGDLLSPATFARFAARLTLAAPSRQLLDAGTKWRAARPHFAAESSQIKREPIVDAPRARTRPLGTTVFFNALKNADSPLVPLGTSLGSRYASFPACSAACGPTRAFSTPWRQYFFKQNRVTEAAGTLRANDNGAHKTSARGGVFFRARTSHLRPCRGSAILDELQYWRLHLRCRCGI